MGVIAGDDAYGRGGANIFADEVGCTAVNKDNALPLSYFLR